MVMLRIHPIYYLTGDLRCYHIIGNSIADPSLIELIGQEAKKIVIDTEEISAMLSRVEESAGCYLRKLTRSFETRCSDWVI